MKIKELFKGIQATNKIQEALESESRASVQLYVDDSPIGHECHSLYEFNYYLEAEYTEDFIKAVMEAEFVKTYNNTLSVTLNFKHGDFEWSQKVELFVDMGGF